jgi:hypothetical protein
VAVCGAVLLLTSALSAPAAAAPGQPVPSVAIDLIVETVAPDVLQVGLMYTCWPSPTALGDVTVNLSQSSPLPAMGYGGADLTCDGANHRAVVMVFGGPVFAPGPAFATAQACTALTCGTDARKVTIVPVQLPVVALGSKPKHRN